MPVSSFYLKIRKYFGFYAKQFKHVMECSISPWCAPNSPKMTVNGVFFLEVPYDAKFTLLITLLTIMSSQSVNSSEKGKVHPQLLLHAPLARKLKHTEFW